MALLVSADTVRALIPNGVYSLQLLEQRDKQRVVVTLALASSSAGHTVQIDTTETQILALFQHLLTTVPAAARRARGPRAARQRAESATEARQQPPAAVDGQGPTSAPRQTRRRRSPSRSAV